MWDDEEKHFPRCGKSVDRDFPPADRNKNNEVEANVTRETIESIRTDNLGNRSESTIRSVWAVDGDREATNADTTTNEETNSRRNRNISDRSSRRSDLDKRLTWSKTGR